MEIYSIDVKLIEKADCVTDASVDKERHIKTLPYLSVAQSLTGSYDISIDDREKKQTGEGGFFIAPARAKQDITHNIGKDGTMHLRWLFLDVTINGIYPIDTLYSFPTLCPKEKKDAMHNLFNELFVADDLCDRISVCYKIVKLLLSTAKEKKVIPGRDMLRITEYIHTRYQKNISVSTLAGLINMSESNFYVFFRKYYNTSPIAYVNDYRLMIASLLLKTTEKRIGVIAEETGFSDQFYFSKLFKAKYHLSPKDYRKIIRI